MPRNRSSGAAQSAIHEALKDKAMHWSADDWRHEVAKLHPFEVEQLIPLCDEPIDPVHWKEHLAGAISGLNDRPHLEAVGRALSLTQSHEVFSYIKKDNTIIDKLAPIFVGMQHAIFREVLFTMSKDELDLLKQEALTEAIQYHLSLVLSELEVELKSYEEDLIKLGKEVSQLPLSNISQKVLNEINFLVDEQIDRGLHWIKIANSGLSIAWNTLRVDLIDQLSQTKEAFQRAIHLTIGTHKNEEHAATGIYAILENRLNSVFLESLSGEHLAAMPDTTPILEALVKLGIWYEQDYFDVGLITSETLDKNSLLPLTGQERKEERERIYLEVTKKLKSLGLNALSDLKSKHIYNREALKEYTKSYLSSV